MQGVSECIGPKEDRDHCTICSDPLLDDDGIMLHNGGCKNAFHKHCLLEAVDRSNGRCPNCRGQISPSISDEERWSRFEHLFKLRLAKAECRLQRWAACEDVSTSDDDAHAWIDRVADASPNVRQQFYAEYEKVFPGFKAQKLYHSRVSASRKLYLERTEAARLLHDKQTEIYALTLESNRMKEVRAHEKKFIDLMRWRYEAIMVGNTPKADDLYREAAHLERAFVETRLQHSQQDSAILEGAHMRMQEELLEDIEHRLDNFRHTVGFLH